ncbi:MAG: hypothetical protein EAZ66_04450 [Alphaproteobacteria bacterium]|nr:MAG: hypothetical protein EAZ66_04450 [Alphaproteobacteria bacterium]
MAACRRIVCATAAYLKKFGTPKVPNDLTHHRCLLLRQTDSNFATWTFNKGRVTERIRVSGHLASNDGEVVKNWVLNHQGIMLRSEWDVSAEIGRKQLVQVLTDYTAAPGDIGAWYLPGAQKTARVAKFLDLLSDEFKGPQSWRLPS